MSHWEVAAVVFALLYLVLAVRQNILCWVAALISTSIYLWLFYDVQLYAEASLQVFYIAMAVYGFWQWRYGGSDKSELPVSVWSPGKHIACVLAIVVIAAALGAYLDTKTDQALPYLDAFTTAGALFTTYMTARKILENWYYWFVIDSVSIYLYLERGLVLTAMLFVIYLVLVVMGFISWRRHYQAQPS